MINPQLFGYNYPYLEHISMDQTCSSHWGSTVNIGKENELMKRKYNRDTSLKRSTVKNRWWLKLEAVVPVLFLLFVALWFILRGDLLYVFPCVILFLCFSVLLVLRLPHLGKRELILVLFVRLFDLCLFRFVCFLFFLGSGKGCGL